MNYLKWLAISLGVTSAHAYILITNVAPITPPSIENSSLEPELINISISTVTSFNDQPMEETELQESPIMQDLCQELEEDMAKTLQEREKRQNLRKEKQQEEKLAEQKRQELLAQKHRKELKKKQRAAKQAQQSKDRAKAKRLAQARHRAALAKKIVKRPSVISKTKPAYPYSLRKKGIEGRVTILVHINKTGKVSSARISKSSGHVLFDQTALQAIKRWKYSPAVNALKQNVSYNKHERIVFQLQ